jgi:NAD(P)-dependent dehydrogenase (short-subunit alcohol dehydrogenase family)
MVGGPLAGCVAVVTGAGRGRGREFAIALSRAGSAVVVNNRNRRVGPDGRGPADSVVEEIVQAGGTAVADHCDVRVPGGQAGPLSNGLSRNGASWTSALQTPGSIGRPCSIAKATRSSRRSSR